MQKIYDKWVWLINEYGAGKNIENVISFNKWADWELNENKSFRLYQDLEEIKLKCQSMSLHFDKIKYISMMSYQGYNINKY